MNLLRIYHTIKYLKPIQIGYQLKYRLKPLSTDLKVFKEEIGELKINNLNFTPYIPKPESYKDNNTFEFLNLSKSFVQDNINWEENNFGKLWCYNLSYMDYLLQPSMSKETGLKLIDGFIESVPHDKISLEPYPTSLRSINWIKFVSKYKINDDKINHYLYLQYQLLNKRLEFHLLGNHLLENTFSLLFGTFYFSDKKFYNKAKKLLNKELNEQILTDGGHFELSPMYHQIILDRLLDSINLIQNNQVFSDQDELQNLLENKAALMLGWLKQMTLSNGDIPLFNDSTKGIAPSSEKLFDYANRLNISENRQPLSASGYRRFSTSNYECIVDVGQIGPDYIPGHAHADMLSFVLYVNGKPLIIDPGISTYEKNEQRELERSTEFHNTVLIKEKNQSDVWGGFRVGKRARIVILSDGQDRIKAYHNGYRPVLHEREFHFEENRVTIFDKMNREIKAKAFFYFASSINVQKNAGFLKIENLKISFSNAEKIERNEFSLPVGYNKFSKSDKVVVAFNKTLKTVIELI